MMKRNTLKKRKSITSGAALLGALLLTGCGLGLNNDNLRGHYQVSRGFLSSQNFNNNTGGQTNPNQGFGQQLVTFGSGQFMVYQGSSTMPLSSGSYSIIDEERLQLLPQMFNQGGFGNGGTAQFQEMILSSDDIQDNGDQELKIWRFNEDQIEIRQLRFDEFQFQMGGNNGAFGGQQFTAEQLQNWYNNPDQFIQERNNNNFGNGGIQQQ